MGITRANLTSFDTNNQGSELLGDLGKESVRCFSSRRVKRCLKHIAQ